MSGLSDRIAHNPVVPYIRESDLALRKPWRTPERRLLDYLLIFIQEGKCRIRVDGEVFLFQAGEFCLVQPGSLVDLEGLTETTTPFAHFDIFYNTHRALSFPTRPGQVDLTAYTELMQPRLYEVYGTQVPVRLKPRSPIKFRDEILQMVELWQQPDPLKQLKAQRSALDIVVAILDAYDTPDKPDASSSHSFNWITSYLSFHLSEPLSIESMAKRASLSPSRFSALFKQRFSLSPHQYLLNMRVAHAKELLRNTELTQNEIASYCGFSDIHHFSKTFRKRTGAAPGEYQKMEKHSQKQGG